MDRRKFVAFLGGLPFIGTFVPKVQAMKPTNKAEFVDITWFNHLPEFTVKRLSFNRDFIEKGAETGQFEEIITAKKFLTGHHFIYERPKDLLCVTDITPDKTVYSLQLPQIIFTTDQKRLVIWASAQTEVDELIDQLQKHYNQKLELIDHSELPDVNLDLRFKNVAIKINLYRALLKID